MIDLIASGLGLVIRFIYDLVGSNYGLSIIIFTILTKIILFPLNYKQSKGMKDIQKLAPLQDEIREKYKGNKEKQAEELAKVYEQHKINPMSGCLPLLIQLPIIFAMFYIVRQPLTYILQIPNSQIIEYAEEYLEKEEVSEKEAKAVEINMASKLKLIDMNFFGIDFGAVPSDSMNKELESRPSKWTIIVPVLSILLSYLQTWLNQRKSTMTEEQKQQQKSMNIMMPILSGYISYIMPLALGIYWLLGNVLGIISQLIIDFMLSKEKILLQEEKKK